MEGPQLALLGEQSECKGRDVHDFQVRELMQRIPRGQVKEEPGEVSLQQWEVQWQEFLKTLDSPQIQLPTSALSEEPSPWSNPKAFLASFEQVAKACRWPRETWVARLLPALQGEAEQALFGVETGDREDYGKVKVAILRKDAIRREKHRQHFRLFCYREAEDLRAVCSQLQELCHRWLEVERHSKEQILELLVLEQFMTILPPEIQNQVREHGPETCAQAVTLAEDFILGQQEKRRETNQVTLEESTLSLGKADQVPSVMEQTNLHEKNKQEEKEGEPDLLGAVWHCEAEGESQGFSLETIPTLEVEEAPADQVGLKWLPGRDLGLLEEQRNKSIAIQQSFRQPKTKKCKKCPVCGKMFSSKSGLQVHQKAHTGEKPYKCSECRKSFTQVSNLMSHKKIHTGERPYHCTECGKHFGRKHHLKSHWKTHTGEKPYACLECGKCFSECTYLTKHRRIHTGEKPYNCLECEKCFTRSDHLASHQKMHAERKTCKRKKLLPKVNPPSCP